MPLKKVDYDDRQHAVYARGRATGAAEMGRLMRRFAGELPAARPLAIVDLGCGVGRLTPALAGAFGGPVHGVEPSRKMREIAEADGRHPAVRYLAGEAARMPLADRSADAVLMFLSWHHVPDHEAAAAEIARVLRPGGRVLIQGAFSDILTSDWGDQFFPRARQIMLEAYPTTAATEAAFARAGLTRIALVETTDVLAPSVADYAERLRLRAYSTFEHMTETEIAEGFARMDAALAAGTPPGPVEKVGHLMVLG